MAITDVLIIVNTEVWMKLTKLEELSKVIVEIVIFSTFIVSVIV